MYELSEISLNQWRFTSPSRTITGSFKSVIRVAIAEFGVEADQFDMAIQEMVKNGHNTAHFGVYRSLIYTYEKDLRKVG